MYSVGVRVRVPVGVGVCVQCTGVCVPVGVGVCVCLVVHALGCCHPPSWIFFTGMRCFSQGWDVFHKDGMFFTALN